MIPFYHPAPAPPAAFSAQPLPAKSANFLSRLVFHWATPLIKAGYSRPLNPEDLWTLPRDLECKTVADQLESNLSQRPEARPAPSASTSDRFSAASSRAYVKQARESLCPLDDTHGYAVSHDSAWLPTVPSLPSLADSDAHTDTEPTETLGRVHEHTTIRDEKEHDVSLIRAMYTTVKVQWWIAVATKLCAATLQITYPLVTQLLLSELSTAHAYAAGTSDTPPGSIAYGIALSLALFAMVQGASLFGYHALQRGSVIGFLMRASLIDLISRKSINLSTTAKTNLTTGKLTTMVSADASFLDFSAPMTVDLVVQPVQIVVGVALLIWTLGYSALVGVAVLALAGPLQAYSFTRMLRTRLAQLIHVDARVRILSSTITSIRSVKLFAYTGFFSKRVKHLRKKEVAELRRNGRVRAGMNGSMVLIPTLAAVASFITYASTSHPLSASLIFTALQYFNILKTPIAFLPMCFTAVSDALVGIGRIGALLRAEEMPGVRICKKPRGEWGVDVKGDFEFERIPTPESRSESKPKPKPKQNPTLEKPNPFRLENIDLRIPHGALVCIIGRVGSGKSALLAGLINEMRQTSGHAVFGGDVAYVPQQPWIHSGSVRDNITFSADTGEVDEGRLDSAIDACGLRLDVDGMTDGDLTDVGEKGLFLSGGQRQRLALARAAYSSASVCLLDDPLSAVDPNVAHHILHNCLLSGPLSTRTRILVTHQMWVLPRADWVVVMDSEDGVGRVLRTGTWERLSADGALGGLVGELDQVHGGSQSPAPTPPAPTPAAPTPPAPTPAAARPRPDPGQDDVPKPKTQLNNRTSDEDRPTGSIPWSIYTTYLDATGSVLWPIIFGFMLLMTQITTVGNSLLLGFWSSDSWGLTQGEYMAIYGALGIAMGVFTFGASYAMFLAGVRASYSLFINAWERVMRAPISWHDQTPSGRIISRLSKDIEMLDDRMAFAWETLLVNGLSAFGTFGLILYTYPWLGIAFAPLTVFYYVAGSYYRQTSREIKRIDSVSRSYIYSSFGEQLDGSSVIRAFGKQAMFEKRMQAAINTEGQAYILTAICRWLGVRLDFSSNLLILLIAIVGVVLRDSVDPSAFGVVFSYTLAAAALFSNLVSLYAQVELEMNNAERIIHYTSLPQEPAPTLPSDPVSWPTTGSIQFRNLSLRYSSTAPWILRNLTFSITPGEKVGVIGRTGAGKSSLVGAIMRAVDEEGVEGSVVVDGVDIRKIGVDRLRQGVGLIPQEAFLFEGTVRENMDPLGQHSDAHLNSLLSLIHSDPIATSSQSLRDKFKLDSVVGDGGSNFSGGEKQLLALMRALARNTKILLLDEATSSVDGETDALIQRIIQNHLKGVTLVSIAHRLHSLAYYDRIIVLDQGRVAEFDSPLALFDKRDSIFRQLCDRVNLRRQDLLNLRHDALHGAQSARDHQSLCHAWTIADAWAAGGGVRVSQWSSMS